MYPGLAFLLIYSSQPAEESIFTLLRLSDRIMWHTAIRCM